MSDIEDLVDEIAKVDGGSGLRRKLEEVLAENQELRSSVLTSQAEKVLGGNKYPLVSTDDLSGVGLEELEERAEALQQERLQARESTVRAVLAEKGYEGEDLDRMVGDLIGPSAEGKQDPDSEAWKRFRAGSVTGGKLEPVVKENDLHGLDAIAHALRGK
jgi:hypothetical protein